MINFEKFVDWATARFGNIRIRGSEIQINSIFTEKPDRKHKLWCNPKGGKQKSPHGVYHCWKTDKTGTLVSLVMEVDKCSFEEAVDLLEGTTTTFRELEQQVENMFNPNGTVQVPVAQLSLPSNSYLISELPEEDFFRLVAEQYLLNRKIPIDNLYVCIAGRYSNRIIIPYYSATGELIYFNARYIGSNATNKVEKYMGPDKALGVGKGDVLYVPTWPPALSDLHLTEGEFDAKSIQQSGLWSGAFGGKVMSEKQIGILKKYKYNPIFCLDNDSAGEKASLIVSQNAMLLAYDMKPYLIRPPTKYKDWNEMLIAEGGKIIKAYINRYKKPIDDTMSVQLEMQKLKVL